MHGPMVRTFAAIILTAALSGCGSTATPVAETTPAPADRVFAFQSQPDGDFGTLVVTRDRGLQGSAMGVTVTVNGTRAALLRTGERVTLYVPAGESVVSASVMKAEKSTEINFRRGQTRVYRISIDAAAGINFGPSNIPTN
jgi:hypothetical protein